MFILISPGLLEVLSFSGTSFQIQRFTRETSSLPNETPEALLYFSGDAAYGIGMRKEDRGPSSVPCHWGLLSLVLMKFGFIQRIKWTR